MCLDIVGVLNAYQVSVLGRKISECISLSLDFTFHIHRSAMWVSVCLPVFFILTSQAGIYITMKIYACSTVTK